MHVFVINVDRHPLCAQVKGLEGQSDADTKTLLLGVVRHFQTLFDVPNILGVYARMNGIYTKQSETNNVLTTLKYHLDLGNLCTPSLPIFG